MEPESWDKMLEIIGTDEYRIYPWMLIGLALMFRSWFDEIDLLTEGK